MHHRIGLVVYRIGNDGVRVSDVIELRRGEIVTMITQPLTVGHTAALAIAWLDQDGNPMLTTPTPDSAPTWAQTSPAVATLTPSSDGLTASEKAIAAGSDTVTMNVSVGGANFSAQGAFPVSAAPQVLTSVALTATVS